ncbi:MAG: CocE/NonD family hydrolase [Gemmatimonadales bacterium]
MFTLTLACMTAVEAAGAQEFGFPGAAVTDTVVLSQEMPLLASAVLRVYTDADRAVYLSNLFRLQAVARQFADSRRSLAELTRDHPSTVPEIRAANALYTMYATAMEHAGREGSGGALRQEFTRGLRQLDNRSAALVLRALAISPATLAGGVRAALRGQHGRTTISLADALQLVRSYHTREALRALSTIAPPIVAADDRRRYVVRSNIPVKTPDGATSCVVVVRPRRQGRVPALLNFTIYADTFAKRVDARRLASHGYAGVVGFTRGKLCSPNKVVPYEHDGADGAAVIAWIAKQPWSDGRVGMYGGSYEGFTQWAVAKHMPMALKTITPAVPVAPGLDVPMEGNVFVNFIYPWPFFTTNNKTLDSATYNDVGRWNRLKRDWYVTGRAYRDMDKIDGTPNPVFDEWIRHPTYDSYWQRMIPYGAEFAKIRIPVMATAGYYFGGPGAALYYFTEHRKYLPEAAHYLVIGPYDHPQGQRGVVNELGDTVSNLSGAGYEIDPVARLDFWPLRLEWFDYVFHGAPKPAMLRDKITYQVLGANVWQHAPSIDKMADARHRIALGPARLVVDFANRTDVDRVPAGGGIVADAIDTVDALKFVSEPVTESMDVSGLFSAELDVVTNKKDCDLYMSLSELTARGQYVLLSLLTQRASHAGSGSERKLLTPGQRVRLKLSSIRLISRRLQSGSRLVVIVGPIKAPNLQINLGSGKDPSDETIADAGQPMRLELLGGSYVDVPVRRVR